MLSRLASGQAYYFLQSFKEHYLYNSPFTQLTKLNFQLKLQKY